MLRKDINKEETLNEIAEIAKTHKYKIKGCYLFGSQVYGSASEGSDTDVILVANSPSPEVEIKNDKFNVHIIVPDVFLKNAKDNHIKSIECLFAPEWAKIKDFETEFKYKPDSFRHNISHTVSNSWVKCKKKLAQGDYYIGVKSIFHSIRIADFGIQFAKTHKIDFESTNWMWNEIKAKEWTWDELDEKYKPIRNSKLTEFRKLASL
jgi:predicted nucleotidyltransferase